MSLEAAAVRTLADLKAFVHRTLCDKENLVPEQFRMQAMELRRHGRSCGIQFSIHGPRQVRLSAVWASDMNLVYFYDAAGVRYSKVPLRARLAADPDESRVA